LGLIDEVRGQRIFIDTAVFIYFIERDPRYLDTVKPVFVEIDTGNVDAITSTITLLEVLVLPFRKGNQALVEKYRNLILNSDHLTAYEVFHEVSVLASRLRAGYSIRTPDAIQMAVGILYGAQAFLTNDAELKQVKDIKVLIVDDYLVSQPPACTKQP
jgi:predicted nucleic acid-binding protein